MRSWRKRSSHYALCTNHYALIFNSQTACLIADRRRIRPGQRQTAAEFFDVEAFELAARVPVPALDCNSFRQQATAEPVERWALQEQTASFEEQSADFELRTGSFEALAAAGRQRLRFPASEAHRIYVPLLSNRYCQTESTR